ncbi:MAG TPA: H-X9-DG-CTERM domain-containing protein [Verrucomicrobiae bacterium]|nr:H-X9-DG-CTERM domain-containing protein [Verrucomicrobiae bacterium]
MKKAPSPGTIAERAFQLRDLACVTALLGFLLSLQLATLAGTRQGSQADQCRSNLRRLIQAWSMYSADNSGRLVPNNGSSAGHPQGTWVAGWLDFTAHFDNINTVNLVGSDELANHGLLGPYLQRDATVFRCPSDASTVTIFSQVRNRVRSVSMNSWMGGYAYCAGNGGDQYVNYRTQADLSKPSQRWVIGEELSASINDSMLMIRMDIGNGGWIVDYPGSYHSGGAWFSFSDGHVEFRRWVDPRTMPPIRAGELLPLQVPMDPPNPDIAWLQERTSELR